MTTLNGAIAEMESYLRETVAMHRRQPHADSDLVTALIGAKLGGKTLTDDEIVTFLLLPAGFETTTNLLANIMLRLTGHPEEMALPLPHTSAACQDHDRTAGAAC